MALILHPTIHTKPKADYDFIIRIEENALDIYVGNKETREEEQFDFIIEIANEDEEYPAFSYSPKKILKMNFDDDRKNNIVEKHTIIHDFIDNCKNGKLLIHCGEGVSRSPSVLMLYLMCKYSMNFEEVFSKVSSRRRISPNVGFRRQLMKYKNF